MNTVRTTNVSWSKLWFRTCKERVPHLPTVLNEYESFTRRQGFANLKAVVDVGAGSGLSSIPFAKSNYRVILVDYSESALHLAREYYMDVGLYRSLDLVIADAFHLPLRNKSVDLVLSWGLLEHFKPEDSVKILREKLRVGKMLMEIVPYRKCIGYWLAKKLVRLLGRIWPYGDEIERDYEEQEILREVAYAGWRVKCLRKFGRTFGIGFLISVLTSDPLLHRKALSKHPFFERIVATFCQLLSILVNS
jgi:2-polyprenyl-3-methyl-5-hydroxy-6-metoxy-1,4-benzoquinol methylase